MTLFLTRLSLPPIGGSDDSGGSGCKGLEDRGVGNADGGSDLIEAAGVVEGVVRNAREVVAKELLVEVDVAEVGISCSGVCNLSSVITSNVA